MAIGGQFAARPRLNLKSLTSMRAFAALLIFAFHSNIPLVNAITVQGRVGVSFFFVLSGLLLAMSWQPGDTARGFYRRRAARIYPAYLVALIAGAVLSVASSTGERSILGGILSVFLLQAWVPDSGIYFAWNAVSWSLSVEAFFYILFPFIAPAILSLGSKGTSYLRAAALLFVVAMGVYAALTLPDTLEQPNTFESWATYISPATRLAEFVIGMTLVHAVRGPRIRVGKTLSVAILVVAYLLSGLNPGGLGLAALTIIPLCLVLVRFSQGDANGERSILHAGVLLWLGQISYCFYLVHHLVLRAETILISQHGWDFHGTTIPLALVLSLIAAAMLHRFIEVPLDRRFNGRDRARPELPVNPAV